MWKKVVLDDLLEVENGYAFNSKQFSSDGDVPLIRIRDLKKGVDTETRYTGDYDRKYIVSKGDFLIGMDGEFRCYEWKGDDALLNQRVCRLHNFKRNLYERYLFYVINSELKKIEDITGYTTVKHLSSKSIKQIMISLPPLEEQQRIVAKLDVALAEIETIKNNNQDKLKKIKSLAYQAIEMELKNCETNHKKLPISSVTTIQPTKKIISDKLTRDPIVTFINMNNLGIEKKYSSSNDLRKLSDVIKSYQYFEENDVILAKITPCFENGKLSIAKNLSNKIGFGSSEFVVFRPNENLHSDFLYYNLLRKKFRFDGENNMAGAVGHKRVKKEFISKYLITVPPLEIQQNIARKLDKIWEGVLDLENIINKKLTKYKSLVSSVLRDELQNKAS